MRKAGWYVVQVLTGHEDQACEAILRTCALAEKLETADHPELEGGELLQECFSPTFTHRLKFHGEWRDVQRTLIPGYVIAVTADPAKLQRILRATPGFTKLLVFGETYQPLRDEERAWIEAVTRPRERVVPISVGYREGDTLVVAEGPLKGHEALVKRIIRKKSLAVLELHAGGKRITATVGLAVLPKRDGDEAAE
jgi:transcriptional antiterminator NusG